MQSLSKSQIRQLFPDCSAADLALPDLTHVDWGVLDYFGWLRQRWRSGFVVFADSDGLKGMRLRRSINTTSRPRTTCALGAIMFTVAGTVVVQHCRPWQRWATFYWQPYLPKLRLQPAHS